MYSNQRIAKLINGYLRNELDDPELQELTDWRKLAPGNESLFRELTNPKQFQNNIRELYQSREKTYQKILSSIPELKTPRIGKLRLIRLLVAAAAVLLLISSGTWLYLNRAKPTNTTIVHQQKATENDISPGKQGATLTLADGSSIVIDKAANGNLTTQGAARVIKKNGQLSYQSNSDNAGRVLYNKMSTPKGRQYQLELTDGTKVWLNAASSIRFPTSFTGSERRVEVTGEVYFEVARDLKRPFIVHLSAIDVEVLGTHFNINSYADEKVVSTTLLEGRIRVSRGKGTATLSPGQQVRLTGEGKMDLVKNVDVASVMSWKNGYFQFNDEDLPSVLRQVARWYDVEVVYEGPVPRRSFRGKMQRDLQLSQIIKILEKNRVKFRIEAKTIIVKQ